MKKILLVLLISVSFISYGKTMNFKQLQNKNGIFYERKEKNPYTGEAIHYKEGQKQVKINYKNGVQNGEVILYYKRGQIERKGNYENGVFNGEAFPYYETGEIKKKVRYKEGKLNGIPIIKIN